LPGAKENRYTSLTQQSVNPTPPETVLDDVPNWFVAARAAESKKARDLLILDVREITSFTDFFLICTSTNQRQGHAIADEVGKQLKLMGELPVSVEGYDTGEWILLDYGDFVVHIFSEKARSYYDLERLWRHGKAVDLEKTVAEYAG
jgi:ribosome-associated protein